MLIGASVWVNLWYGIANNKQQDKEEKRHEVKEVCVRMYAAAAEAPPAHCTLLFDRQRQRIWSFCSLRGGTLGSIDRCKARTTWCVIVFSDNNETTLSIDLDRKQRWMSPLPFWQFGMDRQVGVLDTIPVGQRTKPSQVGPRFWMNESQSSRKDGVRCKVTPGWWTLCIYVCIDRQLWACYLLCCPTFFWWIRTLQKDIQDKEEATSSFVLGSWQTQVTCPWFLWFEIRLCPSSLLSYSFNSSKRKFLQWMVHSWHNHYLL